MELSFTLVRARNYIRLVTWVGLCGAGITMLLMLVIREFAPPLLSLTNSTSFAPSEFLIVVGINLVIISILRAYVSPEERASMIRAIVSADHPAFRSCPFCGYPPDETLVRDGCAVCAECGRPYSYPFADELPSGWLVEGARRESLAKIGRRLAWYRWVLGWAQGETVAEIVGDSKRRGLLKHVVWIFFVTLLLLIFAAILHFVLSWARMGSLTGLFDNNFTRLLLIALASSDFPVALLLSRWLRAKQRQIETITEERYVRALTSFGETAIAREQASV